MPTRWNPLAQQGYIALSSMIVIAAVVLLIGTSITLVSIDEGQMALSHFLKEANQAVVEGCVENALLYLNENNSLPTTITQPEGTCTVTTNSQTGNTWVFTVTNATGNYSKSIQITCERNTTLTITEWLEL